jgi:CBS domain-containing protein
MQIHEVAVGGPLLTIGEGDDLALANQMMLWAGIRHLPVVRAGVVVGLVSEGDLLRAAARAPKDSSRWLVSEIMTSPVIVIDPDADVSAAASRMVEHRVGCLPVVSSEGEVIGIVTRTDLLNQAALGGLGSVPPTGAGVTSAMRPDPITVHEDDDLMEAALRMQREGIRHLPVVDAVSRVVGVLSDQDVRVATGLAWVRGEEPTVRLRSLKVAHAMSAPAVTVSESASAAQAARQLMSSRVGALPVVDPDDRLVGIVSYVDLLAAAYKPMGGVAPSGIAR